MKVQIYKGNIMGRNVLRGYVFDPLESYYIGDTKTKGVLTMQLDLEPNLNNPAEISWGKDFYFSLVKFVKNILM